LRGPGATSFDRPALRFLTGRHTRNTLKIDRPGAYLIRVESRQTGSDHEHFAAVDLIVEEAKP
jgi:hypothetical protein